MYPLKRHNGNDRRKLAVDLREEKRAHLIRNTSPHSCFYIIREELIKHLWGSDKTSARILSLMQPLGSHDVEHSEPAR